MHTNRYVRKMGMNLISAVCRPQVHKRLTEIDKNSLYVVNKKFKDK
jgi:hypothetical protein